MKRRALIGGIAGILASGFAPAAIGSGILMPIRRVRRPLPYSIGFIDCRYLGIDLAACDDVTSLSKWTYEEGPPEIIDCVQVHPGIHGDWVNGRMVWRGATVDEMARCTEKFDMLNRFDFGAKPCL